MNLEELKHITALQTMDSDALAGIAVALEGKDYADGQAIFAEGDPGDSMYFIVRGHIRIEKRTQTSGAVNKTLAVLESGDYFGEMALFDQQPRSATAIAGGEARLLRLSKAGFDALLRQGSDAALSVLFAMIRTSSDRIRRLSSQVIVYDEIGKAIGESKTLQELLDVVLHQLCMATFADWGLLLLQSQFSSEFELRSVQGLQLLAQQKGLIIAGKGFIEPVLQSPRDMVAKNMVDEEPFKSCGRFGFETPALLLSPIKVEERLLGIIALGGNDVGQFDLNDVNLVRGVARQAGQAILNALHREEEAARSRHARQFVRF